MTSVMEDISPVTHAIRAIESRVNAAIKPVVSAPREPGSEQNDVRFSIDITGIEHIPPDSKLMTLLGDRTYNSIPLNHLETVSMCNKRYLNLEFSLSATHSPVRYL